jgi:hypothetical protein
VPQLTITAGTGYRIVPGFHICLLIYITSDYYLPIAVFFHYTTKSVQFQLSVKKYNKNKFIG